MTEEDKEENRNNNICRLSEKNIDFDKVRDPCHLTGKYCSPAHSICILNVTQKRSIFFDFFPSFSNYGCHLFCKRLVDKKNDKVKIDKFHNTNEESVSVTYRCIRFFDSIRYVSSSIYTLVKTLADISHKT